MDVRRGWSLDEEGWWYSHAIRGEWGEHLKLKVTEGGEEELFALPDDKSELQVADLMQYATHMDIPSYPEHASPLGDWMTKFIKVLQTADDPVPSLEALEILLGHDMWPVLDAIKSEKLSNLKSLAVKYVNVGDMFNLLASAIDAACLPSLKHLELEHSGRSSGDVGHISLAEVTESGQMLALETLSLSKTGVEDAGCEAYANAITSGKLPSLKCLNLSSNEIGIRGIEALGRAIESGELKNLIEFDLSNNYLRTDRGSGHFILAEHMGSGKMHALERLNLVNTRMGAESCEAYARAIISGELPSSCCSIWVQSCRREMCRGSRTCNSIRRIEELG